MNPSTMRRRFAPVVGVAALTLALAACGSNDPADSDDSGSTSGSEDLSGSVVIDGSSTVAPLTTVAAELFMEENPGVNVTVGTSGTGGGFEKFCAGETDISDASRAIEEDETAACEAEGVEFDEFGIANDALTVVVNNENDWATDLTVAQLAAIWAPESTVNNWNQVDPSFPDQALTLFGAGTDSGTFDYFTGAINGEEGASRTDYQATEDDNVTVQGVTGDKGAMGYFGYSYFEENSDNLKAVSVDGVEPSAETVQDGTYTPLGRELFMYPSKQALTDKPEVKAFVEYYIANIDTIVEEAGFIPLNEEQKAALQTAYDQLVG